MRNKKTQEVVEFVKNKTSSLITSPFPKNDVELNHFISEFHYALSFLAENKIYDFENQYMERFKIPQEKQKEVGICMQKIREFNMYLNNHININHLSHPHREYWRMIRQKFLHWTKEHILTSLIVGIILLILSILI